VVVPEKQGLKLCPRTCCCPDRKSISGGSRKTRIETLYHRLRHSNLPSISGGSRKTRIETQNESKDESKPKGISGGSRKTRIETPFWKPFRFG